MNSFKRFSILTLSMLTALTASVCLFPRASAETICSAASPAAPAAPELHTDNTEYNMLVRYDWTVGAGGDTLVLYTNPYDPTVLDTTTYTEYAFPYNLDDALCTPYYLSAKSYNSTTNLYSEEKSVEVCYIENNTPGILSSIRNNNNEWTCHLFPAFDHCF